MNATAPLSGRLSRLCAGGLLAALLTSVQAQTMPPAPGPDGRSPGNAPSPSATAVSPGTPSGTAVSSPGRSTTGYRTVGPDDSPRPGTSSVAPEVSRPPEAVTSAPGSAVTPVDQALRRQSLPPQSQLAPLPKESAIRAPGVASGTPEATVAPLRQPGAPVVVPDDQHAPAAENRVPTVPSPVVRP